MSQTAFSPWVKWAIRDTLGDSLDQPGVYLLAHFAKQPVGPGNPKTSEIVYIGETHTQTLRDRLADFHRSAFLVGDKGNHAGGITYFKVFPGDKGDNLCVSIFPPSILINPKLHATYIMYLEAKLRWEFAEAHHRLPACNKQ
jgi:hypothetical protein